MPDVKPLELFAVTYLEATAKREETPEGDRGTMSLEVGPIDNGTDGEDEVVYFLVTTTATHLRGTLLVKTMGSYRPALPGGSSLLSDPKFLEDFATNEAVYDLAPHASAMLANLGSLVLNTHVVLPPLPPIEVRDTTDKQDAGTS